MDELITQQSSIPQTSHTGFRFLKIISICILIIIVASGGYFLGATRNQQNKPNSVSPRITPPISEIPSGISENNISSSWKTYQNSKADITFQYPPNLLIEHDDLSNDISAITLTNNGFPELTIYISPISKSDEQVADLAKILTTKKLQGFMYSNITIHSINSFELYSFNSQYGYFQEDIEAGKLPPTGGSLTNLEARGTLKDKFYEITYPYNPDTLTSDQRTFNMILSSVKLTK